MILNKSTSNNLVTLGEEDILGLISLSGSVGWDYDERELHSVITAGKVFGHKDEKGKIVSSAAIIPYGNSLASIGMVIVSQEYRGLGLGKLVTQSCIDAISNNIPIMLIATKEGKPLYERMGFKKVDYVEKYICNSFIPNNLPISRELEINQYSKADFNHIVSLDAGAVGAKRETFLLNRIKRAKDCLTVKDATGTILGFGLSVLGSVNLLLGPIVAPNFEVASLLIDKLAHNYQGKLRIDVPSGNDKFMSSLKKQGFDKASRHPIMIINSKHLPPRNRSLYGIAAQIFG